MPLGWVISMQILSIFQKGYSAATVGVDRVLNLFKKYDIKATFFTQGHSAESFGSQVERSDMPAPKCKALLPPTRPTTPSGSLTLQAVVSTGIPMSSFPSYWRSRGAMCS